VFCGSHAFEEWKDERSNHYIGDPDRGGLDMDPEEGRQRMKYGDPEYQRRLEVIQAIPSNKTDAENLNKYSEQDMRDFEIRHLQELTDQAQKMDPDEQMATAKGLNIAVLHNAIGEYIKRQELKAAKIDEANEI
jgi:hypothetical protein